VLADVGMPERDGYEVAEFIKRDPQLASIPVLLLTGAFEPIDETRARAVGCDGVLVKPFEPQMVINRVKDLLAGRRSSGLWGTKPAPPAAERTPAPVDKTAADAAAPAPATSASLEEYFDRLDAAFASVEAATEARSAASASAQAASGSAARGSATTPSGLATHEFPGWDPDLAGDPQRPTVAPTPPAIQVRAVQPPAAQGPAVTPLTAAPTAVPTSVAPSPVAPASRPVSDSPIPSAGSDSPAPASQTHSGAAQRAPAVSTPSLAEAFAALLSAEQGHRVSPSSVGSAAVSDDAMEETVRRVLARMTDQVVRDAVIDVAERLVREEIDRIKQKQ
jgi:CheY-like chemotaxis protein